MHSKQQHGDKKQKSVQADNSVEKVGSVAKSGIGSLHRAQLTPNQLSHADIYRLHTLIGNQNVVQLLRHSAKPITPHKKTEGEHHPTTSDRAGMRIQRRGDDSFRFGGDKELEKIFDGSNTITKGANGLIVTKMQQALIDMGYTLPKYGVDGKFGPETEATLKKFQHDKGAPETGEFDKATLGKMQARFSTRQPYIDNATFDPADPTKGTRALTDEDKAAVHDAMVPARGVGGKAAVFQEDVGGKKYGDEIEGKLNTLIKDLHQELFADKEPLRADPDKNFHDWDVLEDAAAASKEATDTLYGSYAKGPPMTAKDGNFVDQWEDEVTRNAALSPSEKKEKARGIIIYLINSNCGAINNAHSAVPSDPAEKAILDPIVDSLIDTPAKVQMTIEIDVGWKGAQLEGEIYLQRYKQGDDDANRHQLWTLFHTCIHEYIHSLAHSDYHDYAHAFSAKGDDTRYNTLIEGMDDFFTETVRKTVKVDDKLRQKVEGPYYDAKAAVPDIEPGIYSSIEQAEQIVSIIGIRNAQSAYFQGEVELIGGP